MKARCGSLLFLGLAVVSLFFRLPPASAGATTQLTPLTKGQWPDFVSGMPWRVAVDGGYAYVGLFGGGLVIVDISQPTNCVRVAGYDTGGNCCNAAVHGGYAYVAAGPAGLQVLAVTNPAAPVLVGGYTTNYAGAVAVSGGYACVAGAGRVDLFAVTNPAAPCRVGGCVTPTGYANGVAMSDGYACITDDNALVVVAVTNPAAPVFLGNFSTGGSVNQVALSDNRVYLADGSLGLVVFCSLPALQYMMRVDGFTPGLPVTLETAPRLAPSVPWTPLFTTNCPAGSFEFTDLDLAQPAKFYRVRQP